MRLEWRTNKSDGINSFIKSSRYPEKRNTQASTIIQSKGTSSKVDDSMTTESNIDQNEIEDS